MRIVNQSTEADLAIEHLTFGKDDWKARSEARHKAAQEIQDGLQAPIDLSRAVKVEHDAKTDRYRITFANGGATLVLKATDEVAGFVAEHVRAAGTWIGRMEKGTLVDVYLITTA